MPPERRLQEVQWQVSVGKEARGGPVTVTFTSPHRHWPIVVVVDMATFAKWSIVVVKIIEIQVV